MSFVNYISFTKAVSSRIKPTQNDLPIFKGSSLNRKKNENKKTSGEVCQGINEGKESKQAVNSLRAYLASERSTIEQEQGHKSRNEILRTFSKRSATNAEIKSLLQCNTN